MRISNGIQAGAQVPKFCFVDVLNMFVSRRGCSCMLFSKAKLIICVRFWTRMGAL